MKQIRLIGDLNFQKLISSKQFEFLKSVILSDESKFNIFGSDDKKTVWGKTNISFQIKNLKPTFKHRGIHTIIFNAHYLTEFMKWSLLKAYKCQKIYCYVER